MAEEIRKDADHNRFVVVEDGTEVGFATYTELPNAITMNTTFVDPAHQGKGIAGRLIKHALDDLRETSTKRIEPACSYVVAYIEKHPEYRDLTER